MVHYIIKLPGRAAKGTRWRQGRVGFRCQRNVSVVAFNRRSERLEVEGQVLKTQFLHPFKVFFNPVFSRLLVRRNHLRGLCLVNVRSWVSACVVGCLLDQEPSLSPSSKSTLLKLCVSLACVPVVHSVKQSPNGRFWEVGKRGSWNLGLAHKCRSCPFLVTENYPCFFRFHWVSAQVTVTIYATSTWALQEVQQVPFGLRDLFVLYSSQKTSLNKVFCTASRVWDLPPKAPCLMYYFL